MQDSRQMATIRGGVAGLQREIKTLTAEKSKLDAVAGKGDNETVLLTSVFINSLLMRKGISWNQIFTDLEKTIPYNVKVVRIRPTVDDQGHIVLDMIVAAENPTNLVGMFKAFGANAIFGAAVPGNITPPTQTDPLYRFSLNVTYAQKL